MARHNDIVRPCQKREFREQIAVRSHRVRRHLAIGDNGEEVIERVVLCSWFFRPRIRLVAVARLWLKVFSNGHVTTASGFARLSGEPFSPMIY
jgi:hypothetical protein